MSDLSEIKPWLAGFAANLSPSGRRRLSLVIAREMRRSNASRIAKNEQPDGTAMEARKKKRKVTTKSGRIRRTGKMFPKIASARNLRMKAAQDSATIQFAGSVRRVAAINHFGLEDHLTPNPRSPRVRYPVRELLGFSQQDRQIIASRALDHLISK